MGIVELLFLAVGLSMDAFAVSVCKGLSLQKASIKACLICGAWFGFFQFLMPVIGYVLGYRFETYVDAFSAWIAFGLLAFIGGNMIKEALGEEEEEADADLSIKTMFLMAIATSIDALAVGITFTCVPVAIMSGSAFMNTFVGCVMIGITTFVLSMVGVYVGNVFGTKYKSKAELTGGVILVLIGLKILLEHFNIL
ncbi:MAG: manganese efflux pump [Erysipelotrichaceae bacterium]|nr:manganese efflux pump [Erysipelotrichaceae bacterium]